MVACLAASAIADTIDVGLFHQVPVRQLQLNSRAGLRVIDERSGAVVLAQPPSRTPLALGLAEGASGLQLRPGSADRAGPVRTRSEALRIVAQGRDDPIQVAAQPPSAGSRLVPGALVVRRRAGGATDVRVGLQVVNRVSLEDYVATVLASEVSQQWHPEALRALAICIRTYALAPLGRHRTDGFDVCSYAHCQAYGDFALVKPAAVEAARSTAGLLLLHGGQPIEALHHACCGGRTTANEAAWSGSDPLPYLRGGWDAEDGKAFCRAAPEFEWSSDLPAAKLLGALRRDGRTDPGDRLSQINIIARDATDRVTGLELVGTRRQTITGEAFCSVVRHNLGWHAVPSTLFWVTPSKTGFLFRGRGFGHGVGLCQWGAQGRALAGQKCADILKHYFPGTTVARRG